MELVGVGGEACAWGGLCYLAPRGDWSTSPCREHRASKGKPLGSWEGRGMGPSHLWGLERVRRGPPGDVSWEGGLNTARGCVGMV